MNKADIVNGLADKAGITKTLSGEIVDCTVGLIKDALVSGEKVTISDFGTFTVSHRRGFSGRNPRTGDVIEVPERKIPVFRAGKGLKAALNDDGV